MQMGQGRKSILDACSLGALKQLCIEYRVHSEMVIITWAQGHFWKSQFKYKCSACHPHIQVKPLSFKEEATCEYETLDEQKGSALTEGSNSAFRSGDGQVLL